MKAAFVIMPFGKTQEQQRHWKEVYNYMLKRTLEGAGYEVLKADEIGHPGSITGSIVRLLWSADLVVADLSTYNPNVFYELGIRHALRKHGTILICAMGETLPFDISNYKVTFYDVSRLGATEQFKEALDARIKAVADADSSDNPVFDFLQDENDTLREKLARTTYELAKAHESIQIVLHRLVRSFGGTVLLMVSDNLIPMFGDTGTMVDRIAKIRFELAQESCVLLPSVRIIDNAQLSDDTYQICLQDNDVQTRHFCPDQCYVVGDIKGMEDLVEGTIDDPVTKEVAFLVSRAKAHLFKDARTRVVYPEDIFEYELKSTFRRYLTEVEKIMAEQKAAAPEAGPEGTPEDAKSVVA